MQSVISDNGKDKIQSPSVNAKENCYQEDNRAQTTENTNTDHNNNVILTQQDSQLKQLSSISKSQKPRRSTFLDSWKPFDQRKVVLGCSCLKKFQGLWLKLFNRRIKVVYGYPIQTGDLFFFFGFWVLFFYQLIKFNNVPDCKHQGIIVSVVMMMTTIFGCRNGLINYIFGVSIERAILWHKFLGWSTILLSINLWVHSPYSISGILIQTPLLGLVVFSLVPIRRKAWEFFMRFHWVLILFLFVASILHHVPYGYVGVCFFFIDVFFRIYYSNKYKKIASEFYLEKVGSDLVKVTIPVNRKIFYKGGQYFFIMIPKLSYFQWHPFSASSAPYQDNLIFYVKALGDWTRCIYRLAGEQGKPIKIKGYMDGPYGNQTIPLDCEQYQHFMFISGGVGITPIISTAKEITYEKNKGRPLKHVSFIWTTRDEIMAYSMLKKKDLHEHLINEEENIVKTFYHVTQQKQTDKIDLEYLAQSQIVDLLSGRPNLEAYFEEMYKCIKKDNQKYGAVLVCGPSNLISNVEYLAEKYSQEGIRFDVHQEVFEF